MPSWSRREPFQWILAPRIFWGGVSHYAINPLIVALSPGHSHIIRFHPWSTIPTENHLDHAEKIPKFAQMTGTVDVFIHVQAFGTHLTESFHMSKSSRMMDPTCSHEMPSCSAIDLAKIQQSSKISSWIWSIISGVVTVLGCPAQGASQVEKLSCLNWATQFLMVAYNSACSPNFCQNGVNFLRHLFLQEKKTWWQLVPPCCWNRARRLTRFLSASVTRKDLQFSTRTDPSFQQHYWFRPTTWGSRLG